MRDTGHGAEGREREAVQGTPGTWDPDSSAQGVHHEEAVSEGVVPADGGSGYSD